MNKMTVDMRQVDKLERELKTFKKTAIGFASKTAINEAAFESRKQAQALITQKWVLRNKWTARSIQVEKAKSSRNPIAAVGSVSPYMETQEFGGTRGSQGSEGVPIATSVAAGLGQGSRPRKRLPRRPYRLASIKLAKRRKRGSNRSQRNIAAIREAASSGRKFVFLDLKRSKGIFKVTGGAKKPRIKMLWSMSKKSVRIPKNPWLKPSFDKVSKRMPEFYFEALQFQIDRLRLFEGGN